MIHSLIITNKESSILYSQYFVEMTTEEKAEWNQKLLEGAQFDWSLPVEQAMMINDYVCIFCQVNDVRFFVVGDEDELLRMLPLFNERFQSYLLTPLS